MIDMYSIPSSRDPHEPYVREALAQLRGLRDRPGSGTSRDYAADVAEHHFALPKIKPVGAVRPAESPDW
jgi:hypothetical protein